MHKIYLLILVLTTIIYSINALIDGTNNELLPKSNECGVLKTEYFYNRKNISQLDEFPWMARIGFGNTSSSNISYYCSAVLISKQYLLTNAHCLDRPNGPNAFVVVLGDWDAQNRIDEQDCDDNDKCAPVPVQIEIEEIVIHPSSSIKDYLNDIALLRLKDTIEFSDYIRPICLPGAHVSYMDFVAQHLPIIGWQTAKEEKLLKDYVPIVSLKECRKSFSRIGKSITSAEFQICAYSCDQKMRSGSPLMGVQVNNSEAHYYYIVGLTSFGPTSCSANFPDLYVRVDAYLNWIVENIY